MHSVEMIVVMLFGISLIATIAARDTLKGLIAGFFGLMIGAIGADHIYATPRGTFGFLELYDGIPLIPALVGLFAVSEAFYFIEAPLDPDRGGPRADDRGRLGPDHGWRADHAKRWWHVVWTSLIGLADRRRAGRGRGHRRRSWPTSSAAPSRRRPSSTAPATPRG